ncbi:hypothetical protein D3C83_53960 [compost metagenome]
MPVIEAKITPAMCGGVPFPPDANLRSPGFALASAINSLTELAGTAGLTQSTVGAIASSVIGAKSLMGS